MNPSNELLDMIRETQARVDALDAKCAALESRINPEPTPEYISHKLMDHCPPSTPLLENCPPGSDSMQRLVVHLDLFSGIGGFALAAQMVGGIKTVAFCEIDPWARQVLAQNFPGIPDLHELKGWDDLDRWGRWNQPHWAAIQRRTEWAAGMSEIDKLRLLAGEMLRLNVELAERNLELIRVMPVPPIFIPSPND